MKKITASVVIDAFVHITSIDIQVLEKRPYDMYNLFPHGSVTNTEYLMLFRSAQSFFRLFFFHLPATDENRKILERNICQ